MGRWCWGKAGRLAVLGLMMFPGAALAGADDVHPRYTGAQIAAILQDKGYKAELKTSRDGDPMIYSIADGYKYAIYFYNCTKDEERACRLLQFLAIWDNNLDLTLEEVNDFSNRFRVPKMSLRDKSIVFQFNAVVTGVTEGHISDLFDGWEYVLGDVSRFFAEVRQKRAARPS